MKSIAVVFFTVLLFACGNTKQIVVNKNFTPANYTVMGRAVKNNDGTVTLSASAASCTFTFTGKNCTVYLKNNAPYEGDYNYINFEVDGEYAGRQKVDAKEAKPFLITAKQNKQTHILVVSKATEAANGQIIITKIKGNNISNAAQTFAPKSIEPAVVLVSK